MVEHVTFVGPTSPHPDQIGRLPPEYAAFLARMNGFVALRGGLHVRGICEVPRWHSLTEAWYGAAALHALYPAVASNDIPFAQDCVGDQYILRDGTVHRLYSETGELESLGVGFDDFLAHVEADPEGFLALEPLLEFERRGGSLAPGELLSVYPPFCTAEAASGVSLRAIPAEDRLAWLAEFAAQISGIADGEWATGQAEPG